MNGRAAQVAGAGPRQCRTSDIMSESSLATPCVQRSDRAEPVRGCFADVIAEARNCAREHVKIGSPMLGKRVRVGTPSATSALTPRG
jgi:hypothetical protein